MAGYDITRHDTENRRGLEKSEKFNAKEKACPYYPLSNRKDHISLARNRITQNKLIFQ